MSPVSPVSAPSFSVLVIPSFLGLTNLLATSVGPYLNNLYWNFNNFDQAGHYSTSVSKNVFRKGISGSLFLVCTAYLLPILAATGATDLQQDDWKPGALAVAGSAIVGNWLGVWIVISSGISLASCFFAEISADSLQLMGMASRKVCVTVFYREGQHWVSETKLFPFPSDYG